MLRELKYLYAEIDERSIMLGDTAEDGKIIDEDCGEFAEMSLKQASQILDAKPGDYNNTVTIERDGVYPSIKVWRTRQGYLGLLQYTEETCVVMSPDDEAGFVELVRELEGDV